MTSIPEFEMESGPAATGVPEHSAQRHLRPWADQGGLIRIKNTAFQITIHGQRIAWRPKQDHRQRPPFPTPFATPSSIPW